MKPNNFLYGLLIFILIFSSMTYASKPNKTNNTVDFELVEANLLVGISSDNLGLRISSAHYLGEYQSEKAIIPLMKMLHDEKSEGGRIQAALALIKIGNEKGVSMVKKAAKFDESQRVRNMCARFYNAYINDKN